MSSLQQNASFLTFSGELTSAGAVRLLSVMLQALGHRLTLEANGGGDWLRADLAELGEELFRAAQRRPVRRDWFLYELPVLRLEDFQLDAGAACLTQVTLCLTRGRVQQLVAKPNPDGAVPVLEDVFLPLRNLSAYLHAMGDRAVPQLGAQASKMTARQIDEFLLAFGGRILEAEQEELLPLHRYWRHVSPFGVMAQLQRLMSHKTLPICCDKLP